MSGMRKVNMKIMMYFYGCLIRKRYEVFIVCNYESRIIYLYLFVVILV